MSGLRASEGTAAAAWGLSPPPAGKNTHGTEKSGSAGLSDLERENKSFFVEEGKQ
jgi:hypothetical protein